MQIVNFQCGSCGKLMGVSAEHLGSQVHCPHCLAIVQAPAAPSASKTWKSHPAGGGPAKGRPSDSDPVEIHVEIPDAREQESIFTGPEEGLSEDVFGGPPQPRLEIPESAPVMTRPPSPPAVPPGEPAAYPEPAYPELPTPPASARIAAGPPPASADNELPAAALAPRPARNSMVVPMLLIFLVPYSLFTTAYMVWSLLNPRRGFDPLERLPDPKGEGAPRRVSPDSALPGKLKTSLKQPIRVGDMEVTPLKVQLNGDGDLVLHLKMTNTSVDQAFSPMHDSFLYFSEKKPRPYTYLDGGKRVGKLYGGFLEFFKGPNDQRVGERVDDQLNNKERELSSIIRPGQDIYIQLTTADKYRDAQVRELLKTAGPLVWRVQFRRGLVSVRDQRLSATAVIGVEFFTRAIEKTKA